ncbi:50S ribosomal protein L32 [Pseudomonadota bacterium]
MAKHPVPKQKTGKSKTGKRYGSFARMTRIKLTNRVNLVECPNCGEKKLNHHVCKNCGKYRDKQILDMTKEIDKVTKVKA